MITFFNANIVQVGALLALLVFFVLPGRWLAGRAAAALFLVLVLGGMIAFNALVDPYGWLGVNLIPPATVQDRISQVDRYDALPSPPQVLMVGSSRVQTLDPAQVEATCGLSAFNAGISSARSEFYEAMFNYTLARGTPPQHLILALDVEALDVQPAYGSQLILSPLYGQLAIAPAQHAQNYWDIATQFMSSGMLVHSLELVRFELTDARPVNLTSFDERGLIRYEVWDAQIAAGTFVPITDYTIPADYYSNFPRLAPQRTAALERLLQKASDQGTRVYIFLTPSQPALLAAIERSGSPHYAARYAETRALLAALAQRYPLYWYDFTDVAAFGGDPADFYDKWHYRAANAERLLGVILGDVCGGRDGL